MIAPSDQAVTTPSTSRLVDKMSASLQPCPTKSGYSARNCSNNIVVSPSVASKDPKPPNNVNPAKIQVNTQAVVTALGRGPRLTSV
jgi:hypothetical protein